MSQFPSAGHPGSAPNPFAPAPPGYQQPKKSSPWLWILGGVGGLGVLLCGCCVGLTIFGFSQVGKPLMDKLNADATAQQHLGTVNKAGLDFLASTKATEQAGGGGNIMVFNVEGDKGKGVVRAKQAPGGDLHSAVLVLPSGEEVQLGF
jgi:hypothetical protein